MTEITFLSFNQVKSMVQGCFPEHPPWRTRRIMVLIMIPKKIAGQKSRQMVPLLGARMVLIIMFAFMRLVSAEVK